MALVRKKAPGGSTRMTAGSSSSSSRPDWVGVADGSAVVMDSADGNQSLLHLPSHAQAHVAAYLEYEKIVGDADGGVMFTEEEYAAFKAKAIEARANRLYVFWRNLNSGMDCRTVGPSSPCFCGHTYRQHATDNVSNKNVHCRQQGCPCAMYNYIPVRGTQDVRCSSCKHSYDTHNVTGRRVCRHHSSCHCGGFTTSVSCSCQSQFNDHATVFETRAERLAQGLPVDNLLGGGQGYEGLGGITSFNSLVDGVDRLAISDAERARIQGAQRAELMPGEGDNAGQLVPRREKLNQEDEFALYEAKYKKGGSGYSAVSSATYAQKKNRGLAAAAARMGGGAPPAGTPTRYDDDGYDQHAAAASAAPPPRAYSSSASSAAASSSAYPSAASAGASSYGAAPSRGRGPAPAASSSTAARNSSVPACRSCGEPNPVASARFCPHCGVPRS